MSPLTLALSNTPGVFYAFAYWLGAMFYIGQNEKRIHGIKLKIVQGLFLVIIGGFMGATDKVPVPFFLPCVMVVVGLLFLFIKSCCGFSLSNAGYFCIRAFILGEFAASLEWQFFFFGLSSLGLPSTAVINIVFLILCHTTVFLVMYLLERKYKEDNRALVITRRELFVAAVIAVIVYALSNMSYVFDNTPFSSQFTLEIFIIRTLVDLGGVGILFAYHMQLHEFQAKLEIEHMTNMFHMQYANYRMSEESIALVNQKYHDLKHQISLLRAEITSEDKLAYLEQMEADIKTYEAQNKTGNHVLDTILTEKSIKCQNQGIHLTCVAAGGELEFMHPMDITTLFGNALDNAMESVKKMKDPDKRLIHLSVARQKGFLRIRVENCYEGTLVFQNGRPATTKEDSKFHGFGIKSMQSTAKKYGGSVTMSAQRGWFELRILLPLQN